MNSMDQYKLQQEVQFKVRQASDYTRIYRYTVAAKANAVLDGLNIPISLFTPVSSKELTKR